MRDTSVQTILYGNKHIQAQTQIFGYKEKTI